jgi:hypothetical protein
VVARVDVCALACTEIVLLPLLILRYELELTELLHVSICTAARYGASPGVKTETLMMLGVETIKG